MSESDFLGTGWAFPVRVENGQVVLASDEADIADAVDIILSTSPGQRVMLPEFGSKLQELVFYPLNDTTVGLARRYVQEALDQWESRIVVDEIDVAPIPAEAVLMITIHYTIRDSNVPANIVYPFYLQS